MFHHLLINVNVTLTPNLTLSEPCLCWSSGVFPHSGAGPGTGPGFPRPQLLLPGQREGGLHEGVELDPNALLPGPGLCCWVRTVWRPGLVWVGERPVLGLLLGGKGSGLPNGRESSRTVCSERVLESLLGESSRTHTIFFRVGLTTQPPYSNTKRKRVYRSVPLWLPDDFWCFSSREKSQK